MASLTPYNSKRQHDGYDTSFSSNLSLVSHTSIANKIEDGEIDIFSADKYFSGRMDEDDATKANLIARRRHQDKKADLDHTEGHIKPNLQAQTPSVYSESSCNSGSALLRRQGKANKAPPKKNFFANLGCKCACSDKNSVDVEDYSNDYNQNVKADNIKTSPHTHKVQSLQEQEEERKSLEVFGCSFRENGNKSFSLERRMNMLAWDAIPKGEEIEIQGPMMNGESIKDTESEASSDLFEIECLSCSANPVVSPTNCYAPSEASVEWSVVTASAAEFSVLSDSEEQVSTITDLASRKMKKPTGNVSELPKTRYGGILSGCKSQKSVRVVEDVYTTAPRITRSDSFTKMMKFKTDTTKNVGFGSKYRKDLLYIQ